MKCPECRIENPEARRFCRECGARMPWLCPECRIENLPGDKFCGACGCPSPLPAAPDDLKEKPAKEPGERKHVTVLFSDLTGYTAMSGALDPEEVKEIMGRIFGEITRIVNRYEGFIEKFIGDAVMALFGIPKAHEDDPVRAIRAAKEIHEAVRALNPEMELKIGAPLSMHTGVNTGLVVTGEVDLNKGTHGITGDTINLASRLQSQAKPGEILVSHDTYRQAEGYFDFEELEPVKVKGKEPLVRVYRVLTPKQRPITVHRVSGLRADLIGRKMELDQLKDAVERLSKGEGRIFSVFGDAGSGKSRLIEEFKACLDLNRIQWLDGHAYAYAQNIPYFPLIDMMNKSFHIEDGDPSEKIRLKVEAGIENLIRNRRDIVPYVGSLYSLNYPELANIDPEFWKSRLQQAVQTFLSAVALRAPTIFCIEDLHWADPSFVDLLRRTLLEVRQPAIVVCVYRPSFTLFTHPQLNSVGTLYREIHLQDLSSSEARDMLESLLKTERIPSDLIRFVQDKAEGNPFYLEELVNSLIESDTLVNDHGVWTLTRPLSASDISTTLHGVISGRLDRLQMETKRVLQEASVIGRAFLYEILKRITELKRPIDHNLKGLEQLDLIRTRSLHPDLEYVFKHALTQEVAYTGLLKKERREIHERIALVMEQIFKDRLSEFYETLAFHFQRGQSQDKAVQYLIKSGEKSLRRYALEESHQYYKEAFTLLSQKENPSQKEDTLLVDLLIEWALVFYYQGNFTHLTGLLISHEDRVKSLADKARVGLFYSWLGFSLFWQGERMKDSYEYLLKALKLGEEVGNQKVIAYACAFLSKTCAELGLLKEGVAYVNRAKDLASLFADDAVLYMNYLSGKGYLGWFAGEKTKVFESGKDLLDSGQKRSNIRLQAVGYLIMGMYRYLENDLPSAIECTETVHKISRDPYHGQYANVLLGMYYAYSADFESAENALTQVVEFSKELNVEYLSTFAYLFLGVVSIAKGRIRQGMKQIEHAQRTFLKNDRMVLYTLAELILGRVYLRILQKSGQRSLSLLKKNLWFLLTNAPLAARKAEGHFNQVIETAAAIGAKGFLGQAYLDLGLVHKLKGRKDEAKACITGAIQCFRQCDFEMLLKQAQEALASLNPEN